MYDYLGEGKSQIASHHTTGGGKETIQIHNK